MALARPLFILTLVLLMAREGVAAENASTVTGHAAWQKARDQTLKTPGLVRYYDFEDAAGSQPIANRAGSAGALAYRIEKAPGAASEPLGVVSGRWPGKKAVRLDQGFLAAEPPALKDAFTAEAWVRINGPGVHRGNQGSTNGTLLSLGNGYWDGFRLTAHYPGRSIHFEIGRPQPSHSVGIQTASMPDRVWQHLAATWDTRQMRIYVNGQLTAAGKFEGPFTPPKAGAQLRIGFANAGIGSVVLEVDEAALFDRALEPVEVLRRANLNAPMSEAAARLFQSAGEQVEAKDWTAAAASYRELLKTSGLAPDYRAAAQMGLARTLAEERRPGEALRAFARVLEIEGASAAYRRAALAEVARRMSEAGGEPLSRAVYQAVLEMEDLSPADRLRALIQVARSYREEKDFAAARRQYEKLLAAELTSNDRLNLRMELGHLGMEAKEFSAARAEYAKIAEAADAPPAWRSIAGLRIAESYVRQKDYAAAKAAFGKIAAMGGAPPHHRAEAEERAREVARREAGLPARDPKRGRISLPPLPEPGLKLYVAPAGSDDAAGTLQRPLATPRQAQERVRALVRDGKLPAGGVAVYLRSAGYRLRGSWKFSAEDSGTLQSPIVYQAYPGETVRLTGGMRLDGFQPVRDPVILGHLEPAVRERVFQVDLRALGVTRFGQAGVAGKQPELFFNDQPMQLARWPNAGYLRVGPTQGKEELKAWGTIRGHKDGIFGYEGDRPARWKDEKDLWLYGFWYWDWADGYQRVASIDTGRRLITIAPPQHGYGYRQGQRYFALNALGELDAPGEWYLDRDSGMLYFYPPGPLDKAVVEFSLLEEPLVQIEGASHLVLRGLTLDVGRADGVVIRGGKNCLLAGCTIRRFGASGVVLSGGTGHGIFGCDLSVLGRDGTRIQGGDRKTLSPGGHFVENCRIFDFSRIGRTYTPAVQLEGCGNRVAHNLFHHSPHQAMRVEGNDHLVEFNEVHSVVWDSDDQGAVDMWFNPAYRGNVFRYNFWHHVGSGLGHGNAGIRLDDAICGTLVYGNIFYRSSDGSFGGVQIHGGKENVLDNNLFVDCRYAVSFSPWGEKRWLETLQRPDAVQKLTGEINIHQPPYSTRYPDLARLRENPDVNQLWRNLVVQCGEFLTRDRGIQELVDNYITGQDPGFAGMAKLDFRLPEDSPVFDRLGMRPIPVEEIGLYEHPLRASWPASRGQVRPKAESSAATPSHF